MDQNLETLRAALADRYQVERPIGRGGMATVYLAHDLRHNRPVAIKVMSPDLAATIGADRFSREVKIAGKMTHPNVLGVFDSGEAQGLLFYVMPFIDGETLRDKLQREKQLSIDESIQIICEVAEALGYAHSQGIIHRDIKPENILLQKGHALVADFGIARLAEQSAEKLTATGMAVGTAAYMSPEQAAGAPTDARSDIYALGCTLYEMLVGQPPFMGANAMAVMAQHSLATLPEIRVMRQAVPDELEAVIRRAMEKTPADRFQTMEEFKQAVLGEIPATTTVSKYTARYRTQGSVRKDSRRTWAMAGALGVVLIAAVAVLAKGVGQKAAPAPDANKVAVLYFVDATGGTLEHVADGLTESLIEGLAGVPQITVVPVNGVRALRGKDVPSDSIARQFGIGTIVKGTVERQGAQANVSISLVDAQSNSRLYQTSVSVDTAQIVALQGQVADSVESFLRQAIGNEVRVKTERAQTTSTAAWTLAERGARQKRIGDSLMAIRAFPDAHAALARADSLFGLAQQADAQWIRPPAARSLIASTRAQIMPRSPAQLAAIDTGLAHATAALEIESTNPNALEARGRLLHLKYVVTGAADAKLLDSAENALIKSVKANRAQATAWAALSNLYYNKPNITEANRAAKEAYENDAYLASANAILRRLFWTSHDLEMYPEALEWCDKGRARFPSDPFFTECRLWMYTTRLASPNIDSAWAYAARFVELNAPAARPYAEKHSRVLVAGALARTGRDADSARRVLLSARATPEIDPVRELAGNEAVVRVILGDHDEAVSLIESYLARNPSHRAGFATRVSPWWRDLQGNARFKRLLETAR